jgi:hypothetical protein
MLSATAVAIERFAALLWQPGDVREVRIPGYRRSAASGYFDDPALLARAAAAFDGQPNIYLTLNPLAPALLARVANRIKPAQRNTTADPDIIERRWLLVDIDPKRPAGISSTDAEREAAHEMARAIVLHLRDSAGWPMPLTFMSGTTRWTTTT